jgi:hypothetical protein
VIFAGGLKKTGDLHGIYCPQSTAGKPVRRSIRSPDLHPPRRTAALDEAVAFNLNGVEFFFTAFRKP